MRLVTKARERKREREQELAAFVGWQNYLMTPLGKGRRHRGFAAYKKGLGLGERRREPELTEEEEATLTRKLMHRAREMRRRQRR